MLRRIIRPVIVLISLTTVLSGLIQIVNPDFVLSSIGGVSNESSRQLFATIGMFMFLFGAMMIHALYDCDDNRVVVLWSALQKIGAAVAVAIAVYKGIFGLLALAVAVFDLVSGVLFFLYLRILISDSQFKV